MNQLLVAHPRVRIGAVLAAFAALVAACATPGAAPSPSAAAGLAGHPLIGAWTVDVTKADFAAAGITDPNAQNENSGRFTWTFGADGTWTQVQESLDDSPVMNPVFRGTYTVENGNLVATTTFPPEYADAGLHYAWTFEGDEIRFDLLDPPDTTLPVIIETHPWRRAG